MEICLIVSFDSIIKSLSPNSSSTRYGNVFLSKFELLKSKLWSKILLSFITGDLYDFPIKYGYLPSNFPVADDIPTEAKYAYIPFGNSGVLQNLPLWTSKSPNPSYIKSFTINPPLKPVGLFSTFEMSSLYAASYTHLTLPTILRV